MSARRPTRPRRRPVAAVAALVLAALALLVGPALAQEATPPSLRIQQIDAADADATRLVVGWGGAAGALESAQVTVEDESVDVTSVEPYPAREDGWVFVIDNSAAMESGGALQRAREAIAGIIEARPEGTRAAIISVGASTARNVQGWTTDTAELVDAVEGLGPDGDSALLRGLNSAAGLVSARPEILGQVFVFAGGDDTSSTSLAQARGAISATGASVHAVVVEDRGLNAGAVRSVVEAAGGSFRSTANPNAVADLVTEAGTELTSQYVVTVASPLEQGPADLTLTVGDASTSASYVVGATVAGARALAPVDVVEPGGVGFLRENGFLLGVIAAVLAAALAIYAIGSLFVRDDSLNAVLQPYAEGQVFDPDAEDRDSSLARSALVQRAVELTSNVAERQGLLTRAEGALERANLPLRAGEGLFFYAAGVALLVGLVFVLTRNVMATLVVAGIIALVPPAAVSFLAKRRQKQFLAQLPDTLQLLAGTLKAGYSLMQGVEAVSREVEDPMGQELRRVVTESRLGRPLEESLEASAERMDSADFAWAVMAIRIQREVGGNLAELLLTVADTMTQRERLRRDVNALTAEGRVSAIVLGLLPIGIGGAMYAVNPEYIGKLFEDSTGNMMLGASIVLAGVGFLWMKKVIEIDI